jgi:hypothetical protein
VAQGDGLIAVGEARNLHERRVIIRLIVTTAAAVRNMSQNMEHLHDLAIAFPGPAV